MTPQDIEPGTPVERAVSLHIALVVPRYNPHVGGVETHVEHLALQAAARGHSVDVLAQERDRKLPRDQLANGVRVRRFQIAFPSAHYAVAPGLFRFLRRYSHRYDVVHSHNYQALPALVTAVSARAPIIFTPHYHGSSESRFRTLLHRPYHRFGALLLRRARRVICVSRREAALLERDFPWVGDRVEVIPNGVDMAALRAAQPFDEPRTVILSAGRLAPYKNVVKIVEALPHLGDEFVLRVTGDGPARQALERRIIELGLERRVMLLGRVETNVLHRWLRTATVFVTMSELEASGIAPLEALASGARVVASDIDAHREIAAATGGSVTLLRPDAPPEEVAVAIADSAKSAVGDAHVLSWSDVSDRTLAVYEAVLAADVSPEPRKDAPSVGA